MADFGKFRNSFQTPWNAPYMLAKGFLACRGIFRVEFWWILRGPKFADFEQKALAMAHVDWKWRILASLANRSKLPETPRKCLKMDF